MLLEKRQYLNWFVESIYQMKLIKAGLKAGKEAPLPLVEENN
jgi:hypothetical protein